MSWKERMRPASFRGVEFSVAAVESEFGRRQVVHQAALVDVPSSEDLGRQADIFVVEGFLVGDDYDLRRDELIKAIRDTAGPGRLVHPYQGDKSVLAFGFRIREDSAEQRACRFTVTFNEAGEQSQPTETTDAPNVLADRAEQIKDASEGNFIERFTASGFPQYVRTAAESGLGVLGDFLKSPTAFVTGITSDVTDVFGTFSDTASGAIDAAAEYQRSISDFIDDITSLVSTPSSLASRVTTLIGSIRGTFGVAQAGGALAGLLAYFTHDKSDSSSDSSPFETPNSRQVASNSAAVTDLIRETAAAELAVVAVSQTYPTVDEAIEARDTVAEVLDQQAAQTSSDQLYDQLVAARAEVIQALPDEDQSPARLLPFTPPATQPALVISQRLYGTADRSDQIVVRNMVRHPGFVTGGQALQVLSDG